MIRLKRSEALWIIRGIRLGKFLRCCVRTARQWLNRYERPIETATAGEAVRAGQAPGFEVMKVIQSTPAKSRPPQSAGKGKRGRKSRPADPLPRARAHAGASRFGR
ncbi:MAG: hypothetical protein R3337_08215 [Gammaproteobacteria bacterium]|nr:hypothetical protein [Gammaproteobacteria bacterium]